MRERMKLSTNEPDDELVVAGVDAVTCEPNVVCELLLTVRCAERGMLAKDVALIDRFELREGSLAAKRVPDMPAIGFVRDVLDRTAEERPLELGLVARRVRPPEHPEVLTQLDV